jgi:uncharacterized Zn-finger protein
MDFDQYYMFNGASGGVRSPGAYSDPSPSDSFGKPTYQHHNSHQHNQIPAPTGSMHNMTPSMSSTTSPNGAMDSGVLMHHHRHNQRQQMHHQQQQHQQQASNDNNNNNNNMPLQLHTDPAARQLMTQLPSAAPIESGIILPQIPVSTYDNSFPVPIDLQPVAHQQSSRIGTAGRNHSHLNSLIPIQPTASTGNPDSNMSPFQFPAGGMFMQAYSTSGNRPIIHLPTPSPEQRRLHRANLKAQGSPRITVRSARSSASQQKTFTCEHEGCGRVFKRGEHLKRHMRTHSGERPFQCPIPECAKRFSRSDNLTQHIRIHSKNKSVIVGPRSKQHVSLTLSEQQQLNAALTAATAASLTKQFTISQSPAVKEPQEQQAAPVNGKPSSAEQQQS